MEPIVINRLNDVSFVITVRIDSPERYSNLDAVLEYMTLNFDSDVWILEADIEQRYTVAIENKKTHHIFIEDHNPVFHRTKYVNKMLCMVHTPITAIWDLDTLVLPEQATDAVDQIRMGNAVMGFPYHGKMYNVDRILCNLYKSTKNMAFLTHYVACHHLMYGRFLISHVSPTQSKLMV